LGAAQGLVQGVLMAIARATGAVGSPFAAIIFGYFISPAAPFVFPGAAFFVGALLFLSSLFFIGRKPEDRPVTAGSVVSAG
jgi:DHA1 family tetracycline resistance protein-like MFS transporter